MDVFLVGGLKELDNLPHRRTRDFRIDDCPAREVVHDLEGPRGRDRRVKRVMRAIRKKLRNHA